MQSQLVPSPAAPAGGNSGSPDKSPSPRNDQNGGDLHPIILRLAAAAPSGVAEMPIADLLASLRGKDPQSFAAVDALAVAAEKATALSDDAAAKWKDKGNAEFASNALQECILSYTHGLLSAKSDDMTATLLNNRSTALFKVRRFADACLDAHKAFTLKPGYWKALLRRGRALEELGLPELAKKDVDAAESECAEAANSEEEMQRLFGEVGVGLVDLALPPRPTLRMPVRVERSARGRGIVAMTRLDCGTVLEETPYALVARAETLLSTCSYCLQFTSCLYHGEPFRAQGTKSKGFFCSRACAEAAWTYYGQQENANAFFFCCPNDALLAWRVMQGERAFPQVVPAGVDEATFDPVGQNNFGAQHVRTLEGSYSKEFVPDTAADGGAVPGGYESVVACLALYMKAVATPGDAERLRKAQRQILLNAFDVQCTVRVSSASLASQQESASMVTSSTTAHVGKALYAVGSLFNHSCDPNCYASFMNNPQGSSPMLVIKTIRPVMEGEELTIAYSGIDMFHFHSMRHRLRTLRERFGFICRCWACMNQVDEPVKEADKDHYIKAADYYQKGRRMIREGQPATAVTVLLQSYEIVMRYICPPPHKPQMMLPKTHDALALAYFHLGDRAKCVEHLKAALQTDIEVHQGNANRVELINEYTRLAFIVPDAAEKQAYAEKATELLRRLYAPSATLDLQIAYTESSFKKAA